MNLLCVCPTYGRRPALLENSIACFVHQTYPAGCRRLLLYDDLGNVGSHEGEEWWTISTSERQPTLPEKYNAAVALGSSIDNWQWDAVVVWEDDDVYLPHYLTAHAEQLIDHQWSKSHRVWSTYGDRLQLERADGRFHASLAIRRDLLLLVGGWIRTARADFDQQFISRLSIVAGPPGRPDMEQTPGYIFRWGDTHAQHGQHLMRAPDDVEWYGRSRPAHTAPIEELLPRYDDEAAKLLQSFAE